jgi:hypothetical protein
MIRSLLAPSAILLALLLSGCASPRIPSPALGPRYRLPLLGLEEDDLLGPAAPPARVARVDAAEVADRCRRLVGSAFTSSRALVAACLGSSLSPDRLEAGEGEPMRRGDPALGDLVLFRDRQGFSEAGLVVAVERDQVEFVFARRGRARLGVLSLSRPDLRRDGERLLNTYLRVIQPTDPPDARYLAGELLAGFRDL